MKTITVCRCGSPRVCRDAEVNVNTGEVNEYDAMRCSECGYDGRIYEEVEVDDDFDVATDFYKPAKETRP